ncbi:MAG: hypothetical protein KJP07_13415, partial [Desulfatitalea sp.]|nr:hypothetical protein [Desulfatitalea sp.]
MSGVFPGAVGIDAFWQNIVGRVDAAVDVSTGRLSEVFPWIYDPLKGVDAAYGKRACLVDGFRFDPDQFPGYGEAVADWDELFKWLLYSVRDALAQCRTDALDKARVGAILAAIALPTR